MDPKSQKNLISEHFFQEACQDWDLERLINALGIANSCALQRNLRALLLGLTPKQAANIIGIKADGLKVGYSTLYGLIRNLTGEDKVGGLSAALVLEKAGYRKNNISTHNENLVSQPEGKKETPNFDCLEQDKEIHQPPTELEFIGRDRDLNELANLSKQAKIVLIKAGGGVGKSTLAREFLQPRSHLKKIILIKMGMESGNVTPAEEKVAQILHTNFDEEPSRDFGINLAILQEKLADRANPIGILIDNLEPALDENYRFREKLRGYDDLLEVLGDRDVFSFTLITSRRSLITPRAKVHEYSLEGLDITAWRQYFHDCENGADSEALMQMCVAYNGNAKVMDILHGAIKNRFDGNIGAYWNRYKDALLADSELATLISVEMDWLRDNQPDAYKLLCRMGCYRYQDVKTVPFEGLICLLWDVTESQRVGVIDYLSKSSLIEFKGEYYLHPAVREAAKSRLEISQQDWKTANIKAGEFWTDSVKTIDTINDSIRAFEASYHYFEIKDFLAAGETLINGRESDLEEESYVSGLGTKFFRFGFSDYMISAIHKVLPNIPLNSYLYMRLLNLLGNNFLAKGQLKEGILHHQKCAEISFDIKEIFWEIVSYINLGYLYLDLWELTKAYTSFQKALSLTPEKSSNFKKLKFYRNYLSFILSMVSPEKNYLNVLQEVDDIITNLSVVGISNHEKSIGYIVLGIAYKEVSEFEKAKSVFLKALDYSNKNSYPHIRCKALNGIAELYRIKGELKKSINFLCESVSNIEKIGARSDLANAYFQLGLTYQAMGEHDQAEEYKAKALELFEQMEAPKQIERVNKAFGDNIQ
ncbi:tetratricopeptide repeat protein [Pseudanabaena mucicola]|uniref:tetratricopeptide repeat protein n=1 Tax=Pseudanabaena mucicola TaxID=71190 RepID=UPI0025772B34|nr:tetratricopeptide repeat protein [Pseudanabaena mucicola]